MIPVVTIVGKSNSGKTGLLEKLIPELKGRGHKVAVVKHMGQDFELDRTDKDSWRLAQSGADMVILSSSQKLASIKAMDHDASLPELTRFIGADFDLILIEGYRNAKAPKIEVHRKALGADLICSTEELLALVTDEKMDVPAPQFATENVSGLADLIERNFLGKDESDIAVFADDKQVPLNPFVKEFLIKTLLGMISALKGVAEVEKLVLWYKRKIKEKR